MARWLARGVVLADIAIAVALLSGCPGSSVFVCGGNNDCKGEGNGSCQDNGFCAFPDVMCDSGLRYGEAAGGGFAGLCVEDGGTGSSDSDGTTTTMTTGPSPVTTETTSTTLPGVTTDRETTSDGETTMNVSSATSTEGSTEPTGSTSTGATEGESTGTTTGEPDCAMLIEDDFEGATPSGLWEVNENGGSFAQRNGLAQFTITATPDDPPVWLETTQQYPLTDLWFRVEIPDQGPLESGTQFIVSLQGDNAEDFEIVIQSPLMFARHWEGGTFVDRASRTYSPAEDRWVQLREDRGSIVFEVSADGELFTEFWSEPIKDLPDAANLWIGFHNFQTLVGLGEVMSAETARACVSPDA